MREGAGWKTCTTSLVLVSRLKFPLTPAHINGDCRWLNPLPTLPRRAGGNENAGIGDGRIFGAGNRGADHSAGAARAACGGGDDFGVAPKPVARIVGGVRGIPAVLAGGGFEAVGLARLRPFRPPRD